MTPKPTTKSEMPAEDSDTDTPDQTDIRVGRRFVSGEILEIERELVAEGADLPNRGIPIEYRERVENCSDADDLRQLIETETDKKHPNQSLIGVVNEKLATRTEDA